MVPKHFYKNISDYEFVVFDLETTGGAPENNGITEIAAIKVRGHKVVDQFQTLVNPQTYLSPIVRRITGIKPHMVADAPKIDEVLPSFLAFCGSRILVSHNTVGDIRFLQHYTQKVCQRPFANYYLCTHLLVDKLIPEAPSKSLKGLSEQFQLNQESDEDDDFHRALFDAKMTHKLLLECLKRFPRRQVIDLLRFQGDIEITKRLGWDIDKDKFQAFVPSPGLLSLYNDQNKRIFVCASTQISKDLKRLTKINDLPKQMYRVMAEAKDIRFETTPDLISAEILEAKIRALEYQDLLVDPHRWHGRHFEYLCLVDKGSCWALLPAPLHEKVLLAYGPIRDVQNLKKKLRSLCQVIFNNEQLNELPIDKKAIKRLVELIPQTIGEFLETSQPIFSHYNTGVLPISENRGIYFFKGYALMEGDLKTVQSFAQQSVHKMRFLLGLDKPQKRTQLFLSHLLLALRSQRRWQFLEHK